MAEEIADNGRISNFEGLLTLIGCIPSCITHRPLPTTKFHWNRRNFMWTDVRTYARTDGQTYETGFIRSTLSKSRPNKHNFISQVTLKSPYSQSTRQCLRNQLMHLGIIRYFLSASLSWLELDVSWTALRNSGDSTSLYSSDRLLAGQYIPQQHNDTRGCN